MVGQGLEGVGQEAVLEIPLGGGHEAVDHLRFQVDIHFEHEADEAGDLPAGLKEQFKIAAGVGAPDDMQDHFQDDIEFAEQVLAQAVVEAFFGSGHSVQQLPLVALQFRGAETLGVAERCQGGAGEESAVDVFDLVMFTYAARHF